MRNYRVFFYECLHVMHAFVVRYNNPQICGSDVVDNDLFRCPIGIFAWLVLTSTQRKCLISGSYRNRLIWIQIVQDIDARADLSDKLFYFWNTGTSTDQNDLLDIFVVSDLR